MDFKSALRAYVMGRLPHDAQLEDVEVQWTPCGFESDPTYGGSYHNEAEFDVVVSYYLPGVHGRRVESLGIEPFSMLLRHLLDVE